MADGGSTPGPEGSDTARLYRVRFDAGARERHARTWAVLCQHFFQRYVPPQATVVDIGAGYCDFANQIRAARRIAVDVNPETARCAAPGVEIVQADIRDLEPLEASSADVAFLSNVLEHLPAKGDLVRTLRAIYRVLRPGGVLLILGPNIRFAPGEYWDFLDHHIPLSDRSLVEALEVCGFAVREVRPRFLPLTTLSRLPQHPALVWLYLKCPPAHRVLGKQYWVVASRPS